MTETEYQSASADLSGKYAIVDDGREMPDVHSSSSGYAGRFTGSVGRYFLSVQADHALSLIQSLGVCRVLDVGGGHGQLLPYLLENGYEVTILGSDESCFTRLSEWRDSGQCRCVSGNIMDPPFADGSFDIVISFRMLAHIYDWHVFVRHLSRVAARAVMVDYPTMMSMNAAIPFFFSLKRGIEGNTRPYRLYSSGRVMRCFREAGLSRFARAEEFFWPMALHRALGRPAISRVIEASARRLRLTRWFGSPVILCAMREDARPCVY